MKPYEQILNGSIHIERNFFEEDLYKKISKEILKLKQQESDLENSFKIIEDKEKNFLESVTKKYGDGTLNPETGLFTPNK
jgi:hypothetical protein